MFDLNVEIKERYNSSYMYNRCVSANITITNLHKDDVETLIKMLNNLKGKLSNYVN